MSLAENYPTDWSEMTMDAVNELWDASPNLPVNALESIKTTNTWDGSYIVDASSQWGRPSYDQLLGFEPEASFAWVTPGEPESTIGSKQRALTPPMAGYHLPMAIRETSPFPSPSPSPSPASSVACDSSTESEREEDPFFSVDDYTYVYEKEEDRHSVDYRHPSQSAYPDSKLADFDYSPFIDGSSPSLAGMYEPVPQFAYPASELGDFDYGAFSDSASESSFNHDLFPIASQDAVDEDVLNVPEDESPLDIPSDTEVEIPAVAPVPPLRITLPALSSLRTMAPLPKRRASPHSLPAHPHLSSDFTFDNPISKQEELEDDDDDDADSDYEDAPSGARRGRKRSATATKDQRASKAGTATKTNLRQPRYTGATLVSCRDPGCTRTFGTIGGMGRHHRARHLGLTAECERCGLVLANDRRDTMKRHMGTQICEGKAQNKTRKTQGRK
ncbi:hypothetical protein DFH09DRAFT_1366618 [Mycena vulgaris]|nr:hypothetical protein DFH09DRAFT_1366618 [Mycena vulgaris]